MGTRYVNAESVSWARGQKPSLVVVLGNGPTYNPANDVKFNRHAQFFSIPSISTAQKSYQLAPFGNTGGTPLDVFRITQSKVFSDYQSFTQEYKPRPRSVTDWTQGLADIFHGNDTYGWPPDPVPIYWSPETRGTAVVLNSFPPYNPAPDMFLRKQQVKYFGEYQEYFTRTPNLPRSVLDSYITYLDTTIVHSNAKFFPEIGGLDYFGFAQKITQNAIFTFPSYNPATDVTRLRQQSKFFQEFEPFFRGQPITRNVLENLPPPYNFANDFKFRRQDQTYPPYVDYPVDFTQFKSRAVILDPIQPPPPPLPGQIVLPSFIGLSWYEASFDIFKLGMLQPRPPRLVHTGVYPPGTVVAQYPPAGTAVFKRTAIHLTVEIENLLGAAFDLDVSKFPYS